MHLIGYFEVILIHWKRYRQYVNLFLFFFRFPWIKVDLVSFMSLIGYWLLYQAIIAHGPFYFIRKTAFADTITVLIADFFSKIEDVLATLIWQLFARIYAKKEILKLWNSCIFGFQFSEHKNNARLNNAYTTRATTMQHKNNFPNIFPSPNFQTPTLVANWNSKCAKNWGLQSYQCQEPSCFTGTRPSQYIRNWVV